MIETPCWVRGGKTAADLRLVRVWNEMRQLGAEAADQTPGRPAVLIERHLAMFCWRTRQADTE